VGTGWPFLVASGRRRDYRTLLAPGPLVDSLDYGVLDSVAPSSTSTVIDVMSARGRRLSIVAASHLLDAGDLGAGDGGVRDEHGRPLRLIYGFVCLDGRVVAPDGADLGQALATALDTYRRFLADEDLLTVEASVPFPLRSRTAGWPVPVAPGRSRSPAVLVGTAIVAAVAVLGVGTVIGWHRPASPPAACPSVSASASARAPSPSPSRSPSPSCPPRR
jgi:hypothetical protein